MAHQTRNISYPTSAPPAAMASRHAHGFRQVLAAVADALASHSPTSASSASNDRLRSAANAPTSGWAELLLKR